MAVTGSRASASSSGAYLNTTDPSGFGQLQNNTLLATLPLNTTSFNHTNLTMGNNYTYQLSIVNSLCDGPLSDTVTYRTLYDLPASMLDKEVHITDPSAAPPSLTLQWNTTMYATSYRLQLYKYETYYNMQYDYQVRDATTTAATSAG